MHVLSMRIDLRFPQAQSLKDKRAGLTSLIEGCRRRFGVAAAEVDHQDTWQRAGIGIATVSSSVRVAEQLMDDVERFVWSFPELEVLAAERHWLEVD